jgi:hypothetical protein
MNWYDRVAKDISCIPDAVEYYNNELIEAKHDCKVGGRLERVAVNQLQDLEAILEYLNIELRRLRSALFRKYLENYQRALSSRDVEKYVDGEADVVDLEKLINEFALIRNKWLGIIKGLDIKQWQVSNVIKLRTAGLDDATL